MGGIGQGFSLTDSELGDYVGSETHLLTLGEIPSHTHTGTIVSSKSKKSSNKNK